MATIDPQLLLNAYCQGVFPMAHDDDIYWYDPDPRTIIPLDSYHLSRSLKRTMNRRTFDVTLDVCFRQVMQACAAPAKGRESTWISPDLIESYSVLHQYGYAHSLETWQDGQLVGGVYGVSIGGLFAGESMFSRVTDASKVALGSLLQFLERAGYRLFDVQFSTDHLKRFGAIEIPRESYHQRLQEALAVDAKLFT